MSDLPTILEMALDPDASVRREIDLAARLMLADEVEDVNRLLNSVPPDLTLVRERLKTVQHVSRDRVVRLAALTGIEGAQTWMLARRDPKVWYAALRKAARPETYELEPSSFELELNFVPATGICGMSTKGVWQLTTQLALESNPVLGRQFIGRVLRESTGTNIDRLLQEVGSEIGAAAGKETLRSLLRDKRPSVRSAAVGPLLHEPTKQDRELVMGLLSDSYALVRVTAAGSLADLRDVRLIEHLRRTIRQVGDEELRYLVLTLPIREWSELGRALLTIFEGRDSELMVLLAQVLSEIDDGVIQDAISRATLKPGRHRAEMLPLLRDNKSPGADATIVACLDDADESVLVQAAYVAGARQIRSAAPRLSVLATSENDIVATAARVALSAITGRPANSSQKRP